MTTPIVSDASGESFSPLHSPTNQSPWYTKAGRWFVSALSAPLRWSSAALVEGASTRISEIFEKNEQEITARLQRTVNQTLLSTTPYSFKNALAAISSFREQPNTDNLARLQQQLEEVAPDKHPALYQTISREDQQKVTSVLLALHAAYPRTEEVSESEIAPDGPLIDEPTQQRLQEIQEILSSRGQAGLVTEISRAGDHLVERVEELIERLEHLPHRILSHALLQPLSTPSLIAPHVQDEGTEPSLLPISPSEENGGFLSYNTLLSKCTAILSQMMGTAGQAASQRAASSLGTMMIFIFDKIKAHLEQNQEYQHIIATIDPLIERVKLTRQSGSWSELMTTLQECKRVMQEQQVYLQGFRLPLNSVRSTSSAIPAFLENLSNHDAALHISRTPIQTKISPAMIEMEALKLQKRASSFGPFKFIAESILRIKPNHAIYAALVEIPPHVESDAWEELFKQRFYAWVDQVDCSWISKEIAKIAYKVIFPLSSFFTKALVHNSVAAFEQWKTAPESRLNPKEIQIIQKLRNWLASLSTSYNEAAAMPHGQSCEFQQMLEEAVQAPERNGGLNSSQLYRAFSEVAVDTFGPSFKWRESISHFFAIQIPSTSSLYFLNPVLKGLNFCCKLIINTFLFFPEWIANTALKWSTHLFLRNSTFLENILNQTIDSLKSNTRTGHSLNKVVYRQLQRIWDSIQRNFNPDVEGTDPLTKHSTHKKLAISRLVEYLFEVLNKSRFGTQDSLRAYLEGRLSVQARAEKEMDELFFPQVLETAISMISLSFESITTEDSLNELLFHSLAIADSGMNLEQQISDEEFAGLEKGIRDLSDQILEASIFYALGEKFDFIGQRQKVAVHQFISELKEQSVEVVAKLQELAAQVDPFAPLSPQTLTTLREAIEASANFQRKRMEALSRADGNRSFHTETKQKLNELSQELVHHFTPIANPLNESTQLYEKNTQLVQLDTLLNQIQNSLHYLHASVHTQGAQLPQLAQFRADFDTLLQYLGQLSSYSPIFPNQEQFTQDKNLLQAALSQADTAQRSIDTLMQAIQLFERLRVDKTHTLRAPPSVELRQDERDLVALIQSLPETFPQRALLDQVLTLMHAESSSAIIQATQGYYQQCGRMMEESNRSLRTAQDLLGVSIQSLKEKTRMERLTAATEVLQNRTTIHRSLETLKKSLSTFTQWTSVVHDLPIWNFFVFDMQWATEITKDLAFNRSKQKTQELMEALYQKHNYIGILHNLLFLPFLEKYGAHHIKRLSPKK